MLFGKMKGFGNQYKSKKIINKKTNTSQEKMINEAIQLQIKGNIREAVKYYQYIINQGCNDHRVFSNYGVILQNNGVFCSQELNQDNYHSYFSLNLEKWIKKQ